MVQKGLRKGDKWHLTPQWLKEDIRKYNEEYNAS